MKKMMETVVLMLAFFASSTIMVKPASFVVSNDDDVVGQNDSNDFLALRDISQVVPLLGQDGIIITSLVATNSPNLVQSRINAMAGLWNVDVPTDRNLDPAAWYWIPNPSMAPLGWQWFDALSTGTNHSWKGSTTLTNLHNSGEYGHRMIIHVTGSYPVSAYTVTVSSSLTNIAPVTFAIGTNTSNGAEIVFNPQFDPDFL